MLNKNMPRYELGMVSTSYFDWFKADGNIYFIWLAQILGDEEDNQYLPKAKLKFQELIMK